MSAEFSSGQTDDAADHVAAVTPAVAADGEGGSGHPEVVLPVDEAAAVRRYASDLGLPGLIDVHTHFMPTPVMDRVWQYFQRGGELIGRPWPIAYRDDEAARLRRLREFGVLAFSSMVYPHKPDMAAWLNDWARDFARVTPGCLQTATFFPEPSAAFYVPAAIEAGARIFKAHVQVGGYDPRDPLLDPVWGVLAEAGIPVVIHAGSGPVPGRHTGPEPIAEVLGRFPGLVPVFAHMGLPDYTAFLDLVAAHPRAYLDTTMAFTDFAEDIAPFPTDARPRLSDLADRILLGTDYPNIPYPYLHALDALARLDLGDPWLRGVLHDNARGLLGPR